MDKIPCIYLIIYRIFKIEANGRIYLDYSCIREILRRRLHKFPKPIHYEVLKDMEELGLIKRLGNTKNIKYELTGKNIDKLINKLNLPV